MAGPQDRDAVNLQAQLLAIVVCKANRRYSVGRVADQFAGNGRSLIASAHDEHAFGLLVWLQLV